MHVGGGGRWGVHWSVGYVWVGYRWVRAWVGRYDDDPVGRFARSSSYTAMPAARSYILTPSAVAPAAVLVLLLYSEITSVQSPVSWTGCRSCGRSRAAVHSFARLPTVRTFARALDRR